MRLTLSRKDAHPQRRELISRLTRGAHSDVNILSYNPGHDGAIAYLKDAHLLVSIEAEKNSNYRYSPISSHDVFNVLGELDEMPDVICTGGWWPRDEHLLGSHAHVGYRGVSKSDVIIDQRRLLGKASPLFLVFSRAIAPTLRFRHVKSTERHPMLCVGMGRRDRRFLRDRF